MKNLTLLFFLLISLVCYSQKITRGPDVGEIYFLGPTNSGEGLYYSTDFGETATFVDGSMNYISIAADKTKGGIYCTTLPVALYYSEDYGYTNSWEFKFYNNYLSSKINSGIIPGHVFSSCWMHSEDYGSNFAEHSLSGWFGSLKTVALDNIDENIGYALVNSASIPDTIFLLRTFDKFENIEIIKKYNLPNGIPVQLSSGNNQGEVYFFNKYYKYLQYSSDYAETFSYIDSYNFPESFSLGVLGGKQTGEIYLHYNFANMMYQNAHIYIFHSIDYGKTFEVFHPFAKGNEPALSNFSSDTTEGEMPFIVDFCNFSIGDIQQYEWDFQNDGIIDSYEETPSWSYQDTGYYSVKLTITGPDSSNTFVKENYIHVYSTTGMENNFQNEIIDFTCYPNPFFQNTSLRFITTKPTNLNIKVYNISGKETVFNKTIDATAGEQSINLELKFLPPGVYIISLTENGEMLGVKKVIVR